MRVLRCLNRMCLFLVSLLFFGSSISATAKASYFAYPRNAEPNLDPGYQAVLEAFRKSKTPGLVGFISKPDQSIALGMGRYGDDLNAIVTPDDAEQLFQLASVSKAFTALGILLLQDEDRITLSDPISKYFPWFHVSYRGQDVDITLSNLLYHTSGLTNGKHIPLLPEGSGSEALQKAVEAFVDADLAFAPGGRMEYGTINYDILGLVIQQVSGMPYEDFMRQRIFEPLGLQNTYAGVENAQQHASLSEGYKVSFLAPRMYTPPPYQGNTPAGYICSSAIDMERWANLQLGLIAAPEPFAHLIVLSHEPDTSVDPVAKRYYAAGWFISEDRSIIEHSGGNPNFTTHIILLPNEKSAACILTNATSINMDRLISNLTDIMQGGEARPYAIGGLQLLDILATSLTLLAALVATFAFARTIVFVRNRNKMHVQPFSLKAYRSAIITFVAMTVLLTLCASWPRLLHYSWYLVRVWMPSSVSIAVIMICVSIVAVFLRTVVRCKYKGQKLAQKPRN